MASILVEFFIILLLMLGNGILAMTEIAVVSSRKVRLRRWAADGDQGARVVLELLDRPASFLSTVQIGITLVGILAGVFGGATLAGELAALLEGIPALGNYAESLGVGIVVVLITYISLVVGELTPKRIAMANPERIATAFAGPMKWLSRISAPAVRLLSFSTSALLRLMRIRPPSEQQLTEEEIESLIEQAASEGVFAPVERQMVRRIFRLNDRRIEALMTPRSEITWLDLADPPEKLRAVLTENRYVKLPVARGDLDNLVGVVHVKDLLTRCFSGQDLDIEGVVERPLVIPESMPALQVLDRFREHRSHIAMVMDEFGGILGLVTTTDLLEKITGDLPEAGVVHDPDIIRRDDGTWLLDGMLSVDEFKELLRLDSLPGEQENYYQTLGGFVASHLGRIPASGDRFKWEHVRFEVVDMDGRRVDKVLATPLGDPTQAVDQKIS